MLLLSLSLSLSLSFLALPTPEGRYRVDEVMQDQREDCYVTTLHINQADMVDSRPYHLVVENERGADRHSITLKVDGLFPGTVNVVNH